MSKKSIIKEVMLILSVLLCLNVFAAGTGFAKEKHKKAESGQENNISNNEDNTSQDWGSNKSEKSNKSSKDETSKKDHQSNEDEGSNNDNQTNNDSHDNHHDDSNKEDDGSVTSDVYKHHKSKNPEKVMPKGLMIAYLQTEGTSAQAVIGDMLLNKYSVTEIVYSFKNGLGKGRHTERENGNGGTSGTIKVIGSNGADDSSVTGTVYNFSAEFLQNVAKELRAQLKASSQTTLETADALEQLSEVYENIGDNQQAIEVQKDAIKTNPHNLQSYKKLGQLFKTGDKKAIKGFVNGEQVTFDVLPIMQKDRTLVPFRAIAESLKAEVIWNQIENTVTVSKNGVVVKLTIGSKTALVNGKEVVLETQAQMINNRTFIPVRFISEAFSADVQWEPDTQSVVVNEIKSTP